MIEKTQRKPSPLLKVCFLSCFQQLNILCVSQESLKLMTLIGTTWSSCLWWRHNPLVQQCPGCQFELLHHQGPPLYLYLFPFLYLYLFPDWCPECLFGLLPRPVKPLYWIQWQTYTMTQNWQKENYLIKTPHGLFQSMYLFPVRVCLCRFIVLHKFVIHELKSA